MRLMNTFDPGEIVFVPRMADSHLHSRSMAERGIDVPALFAELAHRGAGAMVDIAIGPEDLSERRRLLAGYPAAAFTSGIHPSAGAHPDPDRLMEMVAAQLSAGGIAAVGETGLDWFRMYAPRERQIALFEAHVELAAYHKLPIVVHNRDADEDCYRILRGAGVHGVMHCFSSTAGWAERFLECGMHIGFAGNLTYRNAEALRDALRIVPDQRLLLETDAPYLSPLPVRGRVNHSGRIGHLYHAAAALRATTPEQLAAVVDDNTRALFMHAPESAP